MIGTMYVLSALHYFVTIYQLKKDYLVLLNQLNGNLASDVSTRCSGSPQGTKHSPDDDQSIWSKHRKLSSHQVDSREPSNLSSSTELN